MVELSTPGWICADFFGAKLSVSKRDKGWIGEFVKGTTLDVTDQPGLNYFGPLADCPQ